MKSGLEVGELMTRNPIVIPKTLTIQAAAKLMSEKKVGSLLVVEEEDLSGIIVRADIIREVVALAKNPAEVQVADIMTEAVFTTTPNVDILDALQLMADNDIRTLPVLKGDELVGFITAKDILKVNPELFELLSDNIVLREEERKLQYEPFEP
jgi:CBS domain-containing protein